MNFTNILISVLSVFGLLTILFFIVQNHNYKQFQKHMKVGNRCSVFVGENREYGVIKRINTNTVMVTTFAGTVTVPKEEVYC